MAHLEIVGTSEQPVTTAHKVRVKSTPDAPLDGALKVEVLTGSATFYQDPSKPEEFYVVAGDEPGVSTFRVTGTGVSGGVVVDTVTFVYTGAIAPLTALNLAADEPEAK